MNAKQINQQTLLRNEADPLTHTPVHLLSLEGVGKHYGNIVALRDVTMAVDAGRVTCVLGDNGAGKSTLIKIIAGLHKHDAGTFSIFGEPRHLNSPREALDAGIAAVYQDLAVVSLMPIWRNFFENPKTVQFVHRLGAYILFVMALWHLLAAHRRLP